MIATELGGWEAERSGPALLGGKPIFVDKKSRGIVIRAGRHPWFATAYIWHWTPSHGGYFVAVFRILDAQVEAQWNAVTLGDATATPVFAPTGFFP